LIRGIDLVRKAAFLGLALALAAPGAAQTVTSSDVSDVSVTIYRAPNRGQGAMDRNWPQGYALISETRTITIPAGDSVVRFEGVAEGLLPETAIVSGLPKGVREKNRDARLISPAGLVDAFLKRSVRLKRTNRKTGKVIEQDAIIQAGPNGGVILSTKDGVEALGCSGLPERMLYSGVPSDLSAKPTLSVLTTSDRAVTATVQLTYMAQGFDWSASYVARMDPDGKKLGLFAWLTVANGGAQSFKDAHMQVVAGQPRKEANAPPLAQKSPVLRLECWPMDVTSTHPRYIFSRLPWPQEVAEEIDAMSGEIVVTSRKMSRRDMVMAPAPPPPPPEPVAMVAQQEELGDLKLYRVPERVTVAAQSQKQVAMIDQPDAEFARVYSANAGNGGPDWQAMPSLLRGKNSKDKGLGLPLPAGALALFETVNGQELLAGQDDMADKAIDEQVEIALGQSPDVQWKQVETKRTTKRADYLVTISNARSVALKAEILVPYDLAEKPPGLERGRGGWKLPVDVPANDKATITYAIKLARGR
jgi:hypothetical protein